MKTKSKFPPLTKIQRLNRRVKILRLTVESERREKLRAVAIGSELLLMLKALLEKNHGEMGADEFEKAFGFPIQETRSRVEDLIDKAQ